MIEKKVYLFDLDGTLIDTMDGFADIAGRVITDYHPEISFIEARRKYLETSGVPFFRQLEIIIPGCPTNSEKAAIFEETKKGVFFNISFSDDVRKTITTLRERGYIAGISSNNYQHLINQLIEREGLKFDIVLGFMEGFEKGRDHFDYVINKYNINKEELIFIGDSLKDAEKAIYNGISFIGLCNIFNPKDFLKLDRTIITIKKITELLNL
ncbi:MAG: HAD hydrolase-like protein [Spirochaetota bacterium]|nr:HAD hydrolase-like protein [Spirochaetota bacterium]